MSNILLFTKWEETVITSQKKTFVSDDSREKLANVALSGNMIMVTCKYMQMFQ